MYVVLVKSESEKKTTDTHIELYITIMLVFLLLSIVFLLLHVFP